jgi:ATP-dependent Clp protease ATP-binding subunit ClpA
VLDHGTLKDTKGNKVDFSNTIIIKTSLILLDTLSVKILLHLSNYMLKCKV